MCKSESNVVMNAIDIKCANCDGGSEERSVLGRPSGSFPAAPPSSRLGSRPLMSRHCTVIDVVLIHARQSFSLCLH